MTSAPQSTADLLARSRAAGPDVLADAALAGERAAWMYAPEDFALATIARLVREGFAANRNVHYATNFSSPAPEVSFTLDAVSATALEWVASTTEMRVTVDGDGVPHTAADGVFRLDLPGDAESVTIHVRAEAGDAAAIAVLEPAHASWTVSAEGRGPSAPDVRTGSRDVPPHRAGEPLQRVELVERDGVYDTAVPVLGRPVIAADRKPVVRTGETLDEATSAGEHESRHDVVCRPDGRWTTAHPLGFRYLAISEARVEDVHVEAHVRPISRRGAFLTSDPVLDRIWATSAYTLRACMQAVVIDGIKRDRMPWVGDQALALLANAFAFGDAGIVLDGLHALGRPQDGYANGISDYSLWWAIAARLFVRFHGATPETLAPLARQTDELMRTLAQDMGADGVFAPREHESDFADSSAGAVFIDWGLEKEPGRTLTALQMLWHWALRSTAELCEMAGLPSADWSDGAARVRATLTSRAWDAGRRRWGKYLDDGAASCPYADAFAVLADAAAGDSAYRSSFDVADVRAMGTPFMAGFGLLALMRAGEPEQSVAGVRERWTPMLDLGAATFWEDGPDPDASSPWAMYGREFGKSLCHGWASGPAFLLPMAILGVEPIDDGWRSVRVAPRLGDLDWASALVPTPAGDLVIHADQAGVRVTAPDGMRVVTEA